ncbi:hypothetical protein BABINDRAFT_165327 [Babjeviella inositovora NRRL Y-12698]|uniref:F-box domain-containing protein n=1 Tax=Babjeviella inositovora NRRL Y-12698 TaxID=984486 RepID=A0A1E3QVV8_9ASCO|nr:uncharacterized protein BABINDRAFT_165327 [Babjeviella inositovora NRRL Y-12698]ODQ81806.1 hypothetical protein BABINDRAFT_165327 [Babjeviella inositovora NRRL Y-12698]
MIVVEIDLFYILLLFFVICLYFYFNADKGRFKEKEFSLDIADANESTIWDEGDYGQTVNRNETITITSREMEKLFEKWVSTRGKYYENLTKEGHPPHSGLLNLSPDCFTHILFYLNQEDLLNLSVTCKPLYHQVLGKLYSNIHVHDYDNRISRLKSLYASVSKSKLASRTVHGSILNPRSEVLKQGLPILFQGLAYNWTLISPQGFERLANNYHLHSQKVKFIHIEYEFYSAPFLVKIYRNFPHSMIRFPNISAPFEGDTKPLPLDHYYNKVFVNFRRKALWNRLEFLSFNESAMLSFGRFSSDGHLIGADWDSIPDLPPNLKRIELYAIKRYPMSEIFCKWGAQLSVVKYLGVIGNPMDILGQMVDSGGITFIRLDHILMKFTDSPRNMDFSALTLVIHALAAPCLSRIRKLDFIYDSTYQKSDADFLLVDNHNNFIDVETSEYLNSIDQFLLFLGECCVSLDLVSIFSHDRRRNRQFKHVLPNFNLFLLRLPENQLTVLQLLIGCEFSLANFWTGVQHHSQSLKTISWNGNLGRQLLFGNEILSQTSGSSLDHLALDMTNGDLLTSRFIKPNPVENLVEKIFVQEMKMLAKSRGSLNNTLDSILTRGTLQLGCNHEELLSANIIGDSWTLVLQHPLSFPNLLYIVTNGIHLVVYSEFDSVRRVVSVYDPEFSDEMVEHLHTLGSQDKGAVSLDSLVGGSSFLDLVFSVKQDVKEELVMMQKIYVILKELGVKAN